MPGFCSTVTTPRLTQRALARRPGSGDAVTFINARLHEGTEDVGEHNTERIAHRSRRQSKLLQLRRHRFGHQPERVNIPQSAHQTHPEAQKQETVIVPELLYGHEIEEHQHQELEGWKGPKGQGRDTKDHTRRARDEHPALVAPVGVLVKASTRCR